MLFIDFVSERPSRLRLNRVAQIDEGDELGKDFPEEQFVVRVTNPKAIMPLSGIIGRKARGLPTRDYNPGAGNGTLASVPSS